MTDERLDAWLGELRNELSLAPSARLAAGIRVRVTAEQWRFPVRLAMAATVAAIALGTAATLWFRTSMITPALERQPTASILPAPMPPLASVVPEAAGSTPTAARAVRLGTRNQQSPVGLADVASDLPEVLAPPDQGIALRRLLVSLRAGRSSVPAPLANTSTIEALPEPEALVIPLLTLEPLAGTVPAGGVRRTP